MPAPQLASRHRHSRRGIGLRPVLLAAWLVAALVVTLAVAAGRDEPPPSSSDRIVTAASSHDRHGHRRTPFGRRPVVSGTATTPPPATSPAAPAPTAAPTATEAPGGHDGHAGAPGGATANPYVPIDVAKIPSGSKGSGEKLVRAGGTRGETDNGEFRTVCTFSHMAFDDPIVKPGQPGASHLHAFFGNTGTNGNSTAESIAGSGNSTCRGGILNRSAYWVPALVDTRTGTPLTPSHIDGYYKNGFDGLRPDQINPLPKGLRMVAGSAMTTTPQTRRVGQWGCDDGTSRPYQFWDHIPEYCSAGDSTGFEVNFPQCWDGKNLDSADHKSHMAYPENGGCPRAHPVGLPAISIVTHWTVPDGTTAKDLRLASDMYPTDEPGGWSWHGDWFDGWDADTMNSWVSNCNRARKNCFSDLIADGRSLYGER